MTTVRAAAIHAAPILLDTAASTDKARSLIADAAEQDVTFAVFPEVFIPGFPYWINCYPPIIQAGLHTQYAAASISADGPELAAIAESARTHGMTVVMGFSERGGGTLYNSQATIDADGQIRSIHRKLQPTFAERTVWGQGDGSTLQVVDTAAGRVGALACWEHTMNLARQALVVQGEQIHAGSWPGLSTLVGFSEVFDPQVEAMSRNHAITGQTFVVVASNPVTQQMLDVMSEALGPQEFVGVGGGWSAIIHPMTPYLAGPHTGIEETILVADLDLSEIDGVKVFVDSAGHYGRAEVLRLDIDDRPKGAASFSGAGSIGGTASEGRASTAGGSSAVGDISQAATSA